MVQEVVRIRRNTRPGLPWDVTVKHLNEFCKRMKSSGYNEHYRFQVLKSGMEGYEKMLEIERRGGRPVNRLRSWGEDARQKKRSSRARSGLEEAAMTSLYLFHTHLMESWQGGLKRRRLKTTRVAR